MDEQNNEICLNIEIGGQQILIAKIKVDDQGNRTIEFPDENQQENNHVDE